MENNEIVRVEVGNVYCKGSPEGERWATHYLIVKNENGFFFFAECSRYTYEPFEDREFKLYPLPFGTTDKDGKKIYFSFEDTSKFTFVKNTNECFTTKAKYCL